MVINKEFRARCKGCKKEFALYNYKGLAKDSLMGSHYCKEILKWYEKHPRAKSFDKLREVQIGTE